MKEETGLDICAVTFNAITNDVFKVQGKRYVTLWMEGQSPSGEATVEATYEISDLGWFAWDELPHLLFLPLRSLLRGDCYPACQLRPTALA